MHWETSLKRSLIPMSDLKVSWYFDSLPALTKKATVNTVEEKANVI